MTVSIIVPVYNKEEYIRECLDSLVDQTFTGLEIILVDGGSTDSSADICDEYASNDSRIRVVRTGSKGPADSVKQGVLYATGDYCVFVDSDDWIDTDMIEKLLSHAAGEGDEIVLSDYIIERTDGTQTFIYQAITPGEYGPDEVRTGVIPRLFGLEERAVSQSRCMKLFSMDLVRRNIDYPDPDLIFAEDGAFTIPCILDCPRLYFMDHDAMYHYRFVNDSSVHRYKPQMTDNIYRVSAAVRRAISEKYGSDETIKQELLGMYEPECVILLMYAVRNELLGDDRTCTDNIKDICNKPENKRLIMENPVQFRQIFNKLIYHTMKHPTGLNCRILKMIQNMHG